MTLGRRASHRSQNETSLVGHFVWRSHNHETQRKSKRKMSSRGARQGYVANDSCLRIQTDEMLFVRAWNTVGASV